MEQVDCGPKHLHLSSHSCDLVPVPWEESPDGSQLISAVMDIPDLIVKVPAEGKASIGGLWSMRCAVVSHLAR